MNALQDPSKKASINSLLNPQEASAYSSHLNAINSAPLAVNHPISHAQSNLHESAYSATAQFNLRAASWDHSEGSPRRKAVQGPQVQQHYSYTQQPHSVMVTHPPSNGYAYPSSPPKTVRTRMDEAYGYAAGQSGWQAPPQSHQQPGSDMTYGPAQSDERTTLTPEYSTSNQNTYPAYDIPAENSEPPPVWQSAERASVRIAAKGTLPDTTQLTQDRRYNQQTPTYGQQNIYGHSTEPYPHSQSSVAPSASPQVQSIEPSGSSSSSSSKRQLAESETSPAPKAKRPKSKAKSAGSETSTSAATSSGPSKRGYNAKKRSEAAIISAQNADALQRAQQGGNDLRHSQAPGDVPYPTLTLADGTQYIPELQFARCMSNRYRGEDFPRCVSCTRRWAGDTCRFQGIRYFMRDAQGKLCGVSFNESSGQQVSIMEFPTKWSRKFEMEHVTRTKLSIAKALFPVLLAEQDHLNVHEMVRRPRESDVRATCDTCMTSLFSKTFMCRMCGREVCNECYQQVRELTEHPTRATPSELTALVLKREKHAHSNPFFLACTKRVEHGVSEFTPVTRFTDVELERTVDEMREILAKEEKKNPAAPPTIKDSEVSGSSAPDAGPSTETANHHAPPYLGPIHTAHDLYASTTSQFSQQPQSTLPPGPPELNTTFNDGNNTANDFPDPLTTPTYDTYTPTNVAPHITDIPIHRTQIIPAHLYDNRSGSPHLHTGNLAPVFSSLWQKGLPLLVKGVLPRFKLPWTPQSFMDRYGEQSCLVVECQTDTLRRVSIREFFGWFGKYGGRTECWKLKDWPPTAEFKAAFPDLYADFSQAVPVPDYVRRDGVYNIGSHFPTNAVGPDLGPKMYNSMASSQEAGSKGSTRLHMDMADALNVMLHAEPCEDGTEGYAVWDLYRAEDSDVIRGFLKKRFGFNAQQPLNVANGQMGSGGASSKSAGEKAAAPVQMIGHDPIHGQQFYLDVELRKALWEECGVKSFRIYQRPGDGVFIPAGCAHQVANMSDCMKIAIDFVSPENIDRCEKLTKEFREQNQSKVWKEDVLQLRTMMWFAWQSCCIKEEELSKGESKARITDTNVANST